MRVLVPNLGSTSLKYQLIEMSDERVLARGKIERIGGGGGVGEEFEGAGASAGDTEKVPDHAAAVKVLLKEVRQLMGRPLDAAIDAVGFKVVHGGPRYRGSFLVTEDLLKALDEYALVAPLHNRIYRIAISEFREQCRGTPMVAVFESAFHTTVPDEAAIYGIPFEWTEKLEIRRYGFHGASHRYVSCRAPEFLGWASKDSRIVSCHLGGSSSVCAIRNGKSVDCSFGFSPQSGLVQGTRCGDLDPMVLPFIMEQLQLGLAEVLEILHKQSGLLGISGISGDLRDLETSASRGNERAALALRVLVYDTKKYVGAFVATLGGIDALVFTGGIGEHAWQVRRDVCSGLEFLGLYLDEASNRQEANCERVISTQDSNVTVAVIPSNEEIVVARETVRLLSDDSPMAAN